MRISVGEGVIGILTEHYIINQKKDFYYKLLKIFDYNNQHYNVQQEANKYDDLVNFIDHFRVVQFFVSLIEVFDHQKHLSCSEPRFYDLVKEWNRTNRDNKIDERVLLNNYYVLRANNKVIVNPKIKQILHDPDCHQLDENLKFLSRFDKCFFDYPLFRRDTWEPMLRQHNENLESELRIKDLLGEHKNLHNALFHNYRCLRDAFYQALNSHIVNIKYKTWEENIEHYFYLLLEVNRAEIPVQDIIDNLDTNKRDCLVRYAINRLYKEEDIFGIEDLNYLLRLQYVPYEIKGENIHNPKESSRLVAFDERKKQNDITNCFEMIDRTTQCYDSFEYWHYYKELVAEVEFVFQRFNEIIEFREWQNIIDSVDSGIYKYYFSIFVLSTPQYIIKFDSIKLAPIIIKKVFDLRDEYAFQEQTLVNIELLKEELIKDYILWINDQSEEYFKLLLDLYFYLPLKESSFGTGSYPLKNRIRNFVIDTVINYLNEHEVSEYFFEVFENPQNKIDFTTYDLLTAYGQINSEVENKIANIIVNAYMELINGEHFYSSFFDLNGKGNLMYCFNHLDIADIRNKLLTIDFKHEFSALREDEPADTGKYCMLSKKLRFHLGILAMFSVEHNRVEFAEELGEYLLNNFQYFKLYSLNGSSPLSWDEALQDTFTISDNKAFNNRQLLVFFISRILDTNPNADRYIQSIKNRISYSEAVILTQNVRVMSELDIELEQLFPADLNGTGLGMAEREANFLVRAGYPEKALKYIEYLKQIGQNYQSLAHRKVYWSLLEFQALLNLDLDKSIELIETLPEDGQIMAWKGLAYYLQKNYPAAEWCFNIYLKNNKPSLQAVVNYSAVLIETNNDRAIDWCEKYIVEFPDDYLLNANLACAYSKTDVIKSLYYYHIAANLNPEYAPSMYGVLNNTKELLAKVPEIIGNTKDHKETRELTNDFIECFQLTTRRMVNLSIPDLELKIIKTINKAIELHVEKPVNIEKLSENELSDQIFNSLKMSPICQEGIEIVREAPQGYAIAQSGELDFFIYRAGENYENIATGENKVWSPSDFEKQLKQIFGYLRVEGGFGFTIIFNKDTRLQTVLDGRKRILGSFSIEDDDGVLLFEKEGPLIEMSSFSQELRNIILSRHKNPELDNSLVRIYHFIVNSYNPERRFVAEAAR